MLMFLILTLPSVNNQTYPQPFPCVTVRRRSMYDYEQPVGSSPMAYGHRLLSSGTVVAQETILCFIGWHI